MMEVFQEDEKLSTSCAQCKDACIICCGEQVVATQYVDKYCGYVYKFCL